MMEKMSNLTIAACWLVMSAFDAVGLLYVQWLSWNCPKWLTVRNIDLNPLGSPEDLTMSPLVWIIAIVLLIAANAVFVTLVDRLYEEKP